MTGTSRRVGYGVPHGHRRTLARRGDWIALVVLGIPTFAFAFAITIVSTYLPVLTSSFASSTVSSACSSAGRD
jgi:hypothetical protein